jgi:NADH-quinone oxidoreductase subunit M
MVVVFAACHHIHFMQSGAPSFDARQWVDLVLHPGTEIWLFGLSFTAFGCLVPLLPFSFWLQGSVQEASLAGRVFVCAVVVKVGVFGILQFVVPWFPRAAQTFAPTVATLAVVSLLYGAVTLAFESDLARVLARVTAIYMGLAVFGLFSFHPDGVKGSVVLMLSHGILVTAWFAWIAMLEKRTWFGQLPELFGLKCGMPRGTGILAVLSAATMGVPAFGTFVGLWLVSRGSWASGSTLKAAVAGIAVLVMAVVFMNILKKAFGRKGEREREDFRAREVAILIPLLLMVFWIGIQPGRVLEQLDQVTDHFVSRVSGAASLTE